MAAEKEEKQMTGTYIDPAARDEERMRFLRNNKNKLNQQNK
jgi:hypothetical protein